MAEADLHLSAGNLLVLDAPLPLDGGQSLPGVRVAFETCGTLACPDPRIHRFERHA